MAESRESVTDVDHRCQSMEIVPKVKGHVVSGLIHWYTQALRSTEYLSITHCPWCGEELTLTIAELLQTWQEASRG